MGNHAPRVHFSACARGCRDGDDGQRAIDGLAAASATTHIVPEVPAHRHGDSDGLRCVNRAAATQANDKVACVSPAHLGAFHHVRLDGIG